MRERGVALKEIRARELKRQALPSAPPELTVTRYHTSVSEEVFLAWESGEESREESGEESEGYLLGFCRLSLPTTPALTPELEGAAMTGVL